ncbi:unnamed protein product [Hyaloperonospora brassicae]|uniref:Expansin-like EG45 domain-containing protein n=1 Tax=Hyaloperonospora brassicae TaxID=162125 RepID=A0AAV0TGS9_HYABA|nr:unnamed protein product [Hyaloperonospora brassicae]
MVARIGFVATVFSAAAALVAAGDEYFEGDGTSYTLGQVSSGNCNFMSALPTASTNYVALNQEQWNSLGNCGRCIEVSCIDDRCTVKNKTAVVQVLDRCPECKHGALDLSPTVYKEITGLDPHRLKVRWRFVDCPKPESVQVCLKEGSNPNWVAIQPTNGLVGVKSVTVNGGTMTMLDGAYYYVSTTPNTDLSAAKVAITSINGDVISGTYSLTAGECTSTNQQFGSGGTSSSMGSKTPIVKSDRPTASAPLSPTPSKTDVVGSESDTSQNFQLDSKTQQDESSQAEDPKGTLPSTPVPSTGPATTPETGPEVPDATPAPTEDVPEASDASGASDATKKSGVDFTTGLTKVPENPSGETSTNAALPASTPLTGPETVLEVPSTPEAPVVPSTPEAPVVPSTPEAPVEVVPDALEATKAELTDVPTPPGGKSKCSVRTRRRRN